MEKHLTPFFPETLFIFSVSVLFCFLSSVSGKVFSERTILLQFKGSLSDPSELLSSWRADDSDYCSWHGISCGSNSRVSSIRIAGGGGCAGGNTCRSPSCFEYSHVAFRGFGIRRNCSGENGKLAGKLSAVIGKLTELRVLSLPFNEIGGEIPSEIWGLENIEVLDLEGNLISGNLPRDIRGLRKLRVLNLGFNGISGQIPLSLSKCRGLRVLNLVGNRVNGTIPGFIGGFLKLKGLYLSFNQLMGSIPNEWGNKCQNLEHIDLSGNLINGKIPRSLGNCGQLKTLVLSSNKLDGAIPSELGQLWKLEVLDVSRNNLGGPIPAELGNCVNLSVLVLSSMFDPIRREESFGLSRSAGEDNNCFQGSIPMEITMLQQLKIIWAPKANLEGKFPSNWGHCESLEMVNLAQNSFTGEISGLFGACKNLYFLNLSSNRLTVELSARLPVPCITVFDVSENLMSGSIPSFNYSVCPHLPSLKLNFGRLDPPSAYLSFFAYKTHFGNNFSGPMTMLPVTPEQLGSQVDYAFLAGGNKLAGSFPENFFGKCDGLNGMIVNVSNNNISGQIPSKIGEMCRTLKFLDASKNQISGSIPQSLGDLEHLTVLDLSWNKLRGHIPVSLGQLKHLKYLSLASNNLTGAIPSIFEQLHSLEVLDLSLNSLSGEIPQVLVHLRNLTVLLLNNNRLTGKIPLDFPKMSLLTIFNVSFNNFYAPFMVDNCLINCSRILAQPLLSSRSFVALSTSSELQDSTESQNDETTPSENDSESTHNGMNSVELASIISASVIVCVLLALVILLFYTRKLVPNSRVQVSEPSVSDARTITVFNGIGVPLTIENVVQATGNFNASNCIGSGGFGATYKAEISPGILVAVKRLTVERHQGIPQFHAEIRVLGRIRHPNLITLVGYCASEVDTFLIYNYLPGGNLEKFILERARRAVGWQMIHKIALDVACALSYLHHECNPRVLHRDIKPSNILLDDHLNAYLSDFGLSRLLGISETHATTGVAGTFGYVAPEYALTCRVTDKADVYSYGVVLLELISDKRALDPSFSSQRDGFNIVSWACMLLQQGQAKEVFSAGLWDAGHHDDLVDMLHLAVMCTVENLSTRPTMKQVVRRLKQLLPSSS